MRGFGRPHLSAIYCWSCSKNGSLNGLGQLLVHNYAHKNTQKLGDAVEWQEKNTLKPKAAFLCNIFLECLRINL